jgi:hypothetical protein
MDQQLNLGATFAIRQTNDSRVDAATSRLTELENLMVSEHSEVFEDIHRRLQEALSSSSSTEQ